MNGLEASVQLSAAVWKGRAGLGAGLELKRVEVCVRQHALAASLTGLGGSAGVCNALGHRLNNAYVLVFRV